MSDRPTPETDAARHNLTDYRSPVPGSYGYWVYDEAQKLKRERDEAREERDEARLLLKAAQSALDAIHLEVGLKSLSRVASATARQRAEILARTLGKWEETK